MGWDLLFGNWLCTSACIGLCVCHVTGWYVSPAGAESLHAWEQSPGPLVQCGVLWENGVVSGILRGIRNRLSAVVSPAYFSRGRIDPTLAVDPDLRGRLSRVPELGDQTK